MKELPIAKLDEIARPRPMYLPITSSETGKARSNRIPAYLSSTMIALFDCLAPFRYVVFNTFLQWPSWLWSSSVRGRGFKKTALDSVSRSCCVYRYNGCRVLLAMLCVQYRPQLYCALELKERSTKVCNPAGRECSEMQMSSLRILLATLECLRGAKSC